MRETTKSLCPQIGTKTNSLRYHPDCRLKPTAQSHTDICASWITGEDPSAITRESRFPTALMSPFTSLRTAAIPPSAALFARDQPATLLNRRFNFFILYSAFCRLSSICFYFFITKRRGPRRKAGTAPLCKTMMSDDKDLCRRVILRQNRGSHRYSMGRYSRPLFQLSLRQLL